MESIVIVDSSNKFFVQILECYFENFKMHV